MSPAENDDLGLSKHLDLPDTIVERVVRKSLDDVAVAGSKLSAQAWAR